MNGTFERRAIAEFSFPVSVGDLVLLDVDADADLDIAFTRYDATTKRFKLSLIENLLPHAGDANRDGRFDSADLVHVFQIGEYEDGAVGNSTWEEGDWDGDGDFTTTDLVLAFQLGLYERKSLMAPVVTESAVDAWFDFAIADKRPNSFVA